MKAHQSEEERFLESYDASQFARPSVAVDVAIVTVHRGCLAVVLVQRVKQPAKGHWALPGGFVGIEESLDGAASRVLASKTGLQDIYLEQLYTFGAPDRDPRTRVISVGYFALVDHARLLKAMDALAHDETVRLARIDVPWPGEKPEQAHGPVVTQWQDEDLGLAFDHTDQLALLVQRLRGKIDYGALSFQLLPERFTLRQLQDVHEAILARPLNKDSFRRRMLASKLMAPTGDREEGVVHRPAELYRFIR